MELQDDQDKSYQRMFLRALAAFYSLAAVLHLQIILKRIEIIDVTNQFMNAFVYFENKYVILNVKTPEFIKIIGIVMQLWCYIINMMLLLFFVMALARPGSHEQISSLLPDLQSQFMNVMVVILNAIIFTYINYIFYSSAAALVQSSFTISTVLVLFGELNPETASITHA
ncbi:unnamed protein product, partial [Allacma fusca]